MTDKTPTVALIYHGTDAVTYNTFDTIAERGYANIVILAPEGASLPPTPHCRRLAIAPIKSKFSLKARRTIRQALAQCGASVIFCSSTSALANAILGARRCGTKIIGYRGTQAHVHRFDPTYRMALLNHRVDHIVCETPDIKEYLSAYIPTAKLSCHPKPFATEWVADAVANPAERHDNTLQLSYVGVTKGRPHKGLHHLIAAVALLNARNIPCHLTVVGEADDDDIKSAPANVTFTGNRSDAVRFVAASDLFILPSLRDASPRVVREAQACGVPCIVSDIPGARDLIVCNSTKESGILVAPGHPEAIADAVAALNSDSDRRKTMATNAIANIKENYRLDSYIDYFKHLFDNLTQRQ